MLHAKLMRGEALRLKRSFRLRARVLQPWIDLANSLPAFAPPPPLTGMSVPLRSIEDQSERQRYWLAYHVRLMIGGICQGAADGAAGTVVPVASQVIVVHTKDRPVVVVRDAFGRFIDALIQSGVPGNRLGVCPICGKFFIALRKDQPTCGRRCANNYRVREWRKNSLNYEKSRKLGKRLKANGVGVFAAKQNGGNKR
jgi:hypothetical protein